MPREKECAIIFVYSNKHIDVVSNLGIVLKDNDNIGYTILYVPEGATSVSVSRKDTPTHHYEFPNPLEKGKKYTMQFKVTKNNSAEKLEKQSIVKSSDIELLDFRLNPTSLIASANPVYDNTGQACAVIRYTVNNDDFIIEPNLGVVKETKKPGEIIQYVPVGTRRLTIKNDNFMPIRDYEIPVEIAAKATYDVTLSLTYNAVRRQKASPDHDNYLGIGYNLPELSFDADGGKRSFTIHCNGTWDISAPSWCKLSKMSGSGEMEIEVSAKSNSTGETRYGVIGIQSKKIMVTINVEQKN